MGKDVGKGMTSEDIATYLMLMEGEAVEETIRNWGEEIAYELYVTESFTHLNGYVLYYIFEVVIENMKMHYFNNLEGRAIITYLEEVDGGNTMKGKSLLSREVIIISQRDMRDCGEKVFKSFIEKYIEDCMGINITEDSIGRVIKMMETLQYIIQFTHFAYKENIGVLTEEGYLEIKENILQRVTKEVEEDKGKDDGSFRRGNYLHRVINEEYKRVEGE